MSIGRYSPLDRTPTIIDRILSDPRVILGAAVALGLLAIAILLGIWWLAAAPIKAILADQFWFSLIVMAVALFLIINGCALCILAERKISAFIQDRRGPNRVGFWGLLQPVADGIKFLLKEDITPRNVDKPIFILAPSLALVIALLGFAVIPWAGDIQWPWMETGTVTTQVASLDIGLLYIVAVASLGVYGVVLGGWASNSKYAFYGGMRATAQMLSYEVPLGLGLVCILIAAGTLRLEVIAYEQASTGIWNVFYHPVAFLLVLVAAFAETNRAPFDLAECEQELVAGYHTEYSSMKFAMFFLAEYAHMIVGSALVIALFFGAWDPLPFTGWLADTHTWWAALIKFGAYWVKIALFLGLYMVVRWTLPRFRFDQLMKMCWKGLVPLGMGAVVLTIALTAFDVYRMGWLGLIIALICNGALIALTMWIAAQPGQKVTGRQEHLPDVEVYPGRNRGMGAESAGGGAGVAPAELE